MNGIFLAAPGPAVESCFASALFADGGHHQLGKHRLIFDGEQMRQIRSHQILGFVAVTG